MGMFDMEYNWLIIVPSGLIFFFLYFIIIRLKTAFSLEKSSAISASLAITATGLTLLAIKYGHLDIHNARVMNYIHVDTWLGTPLIGLTAVPLMTLILIFAVFHKISVIKQRISSEKSVNLDFKLLRPYLHWKYFVLVAFTFLIGRFGLGIPERIMTIYTIVFFVASPVFQWMRQDVSAFNELELKNRQKDIKEEREKVLSMVENGKVSADDASLLIGALQTNSLPKPQREKGILGGWRIMTVGALLCLLAGGILPWVYFPTRVADADSETIMALKLLKETFADIHGMPSDFAFLFLVHLKKINTALFIVLTLSVPIVFFGLGKWINPRISITITAILLISAIVSLLFSYGRPLVPSFGVYTTFAGLLLMAWAIIEAWKDERI